MFNSSRTLALSVFIIVIVMFSLKKKQKMAEIVESVPLGISKLIKSVKPVKKTKVSKKPRVELKPSEQGSLGSKNKNRPRKEANIDCANVPIDSPEFGKCANTLGAARTTLPGKPQRTAHNINTGFVKENYELETVGNPFSKSLKQKYADDGFVGSVLLSNISKPVSKEAGFVGTSLLTDIPKTVSEVSRLGEAMVSDTKKPISKDGKKAFPFATKSTPRDEGIKKAPFRSTLTLGAAISPSDGKLGMSQEEVEQSAKRLDEVNLVQQTTGGQLNLLIHRP